MSDPIVFVSVSPLRQLKPLEFHIPAWLLFASLALSAQQQDILPVSEEITAARVIGDLPDGTPPPPVPPKPPFIVPAKDILETKTHPQGGRTITIRKITPISLPPPPLAAPPLDITAPAIQERIAEARADDPGQFLIFVGASVFHAKDSPPRSLVRIWPNGSGEPVVFWSSADFAYLSGFSSFTGSDGKEHSLIMSWSITETGNMADFHAEHEADHDVNEIPELAPGKATYAITSRNPDEQSIATIRALHDLYNNEYERLKTAWQGRERARIQQEAELKANPPRPKNLTLNFWRTEKTAAKGGAK
ncbi:MAG: hypothetical protein Q8Q59_04580 [Luteolibacter sp.]|jgi:hypothetical protein|nr:hypothetical protein [Luteolibacter sp.]